MGEACAGGEEDLELEEAGVVFTAPHPYPEAQTRGRRGPLGACLSITHNARARCELHTNFTRARRCWPLAQGCPASRPLCVQPAIMSSGRLNSSTTRVPDPAGTRPQPRPQPITVARFTTVFTQSPSRARTHPTHLTYEPSTCSASRSVRLTAGVSLPSRRLFAALAACAGRPAAG